jgi:hypothetical protein
MEIPKNVKTVELSSSILWISPEGIVYSRPKDGVPPQLSAEEVEEQLKIFKAVVGNEKVCMVLEVNPKAKPPAKEQPDLLAAQLTSITKAMAIIISSPVSRIIANLFFGFKPPSYPVKMFANEQEATAWIKQYL